MASVICYLLCSISVYRVFSGDSLVGVFPRVVVKNSKGWGGCSQRQSALLYSNFKGTSSVFVWVLWHQTGTQYSAGANTSAVVEVRKV